MPARSRLGDPDGRDAHLHAHRPVAGRDVARLLDVATRHHERLASSVAGIPEDSSVFRGRPPSPDGG